MTGRARLPRVVVPRAGATMAATLALLCASPPLAPAGSFDTIPAQASEGRSDTVEIGGTTIVVTWRGPPAAIGQTTMLAWIRRSASIVQGYYGSFPVRALRLRITTVDGATVMSGHTIGGRPPQVDVAAGRLVDADTLSRDWVLVHEMIHLALPQVSAPHNWLAEGLATYVEGVARVRAGNLSEGDLWSEYVRDMPKGLPGPGDQGLDHTHTWGRTYWGGALYCLYADVTIRTRTGNRKGLEDALRAIAAAGAGMDEEWPIERVLATGDAATGTTALANLYADMKDHPVKSDLPGLWADLGIRARNGGTDFDEAARLAAVRRAITGSSAVTAR